MATRSTQYSESTAESTTTSTSDQDKVTVTFTPGSLESWAIFGNSLLGFSGATADTRHKLVNTTESLTYNSVNIEAKDGTDYMSFFGFAVETFGVTPASTTYKIQYSSESALHTAKIKQARIFGIEMDTLDDYEESLGESTTTSSSYQDKVTMSLVVATNGNYTFMFAADMNDTATSALMNVQIDINGTTYVTTDVYLDDTTTYTSVFGIVPGIALTTGTITIKLQYKSDGSNTAKIRNAKIIAFRESAIDQVQSVRQGTRQTRTASTYADVSGATLTFTPAAKEHVIFASSLFDHSSITSSGFNQLTEAGSSACGEAEVEPTNTAEDIPYLAMYRKTLTAASTTWAIQHKAESTGTVGTDEAAIVIFRTESAAAAYTLTMDQGSFSLSGQAMTFKRSKVLEQGSFTLNGQAATLFRGRTVTLDFGSFALNGQAMALKASRQLVMAQGSFTLNGQTAVLFRGRTLTLDFGSFALNGQTVELRRGKSLSVDHGSFSLTGQAMTFLVARKLALNNASFALNGQTMTPRAARQLVMSQASFALNGQTINFQAGRLLSMSHGAFSLSGQTMTPRAARRLDLGTGLFSLNGQDITLTYTPSTVSPIILYRRRRQRPIIKVS